MALSLHASTENTVLPKVIITSDYSLQTTFQSGHFVLINNGDTLSCEMLFRRRGATSLRYDKPSYAIKLVDSLGNKVDTSLLSMRKDNYWILDAMAVDKARLRNRAAMDLWAEIAPPLWYSADEPKAVNGYAGKMVDVWNGDQHMGLYCLTERIDRKQLKLKKYDAKKGGIRGVLYKTVSWAYVGFNSHITSTPSETVAKWQGWEIEYPDAEDDMPITWQPLVRLNNFIVDSDSTLFVDSISYYVDIPTFINYSLLIQLLSAGDNAGKNNYWSFYDIQTSPKATISLWDMDHSWGRMYNSNEELTNHDIYHNFQKKLLQYYPHYLDSLEDRYATLRTFEFTISHLDDLIDKYLSLFQQTGMDTIEENLWSGHNNIELDIQSERSYIHTWLVERLAFLDNKYHYMPIVTYNTEGDTELEPQVCAVIDMYGRCVTDRFVGALPNGFYILLYTNGKTEKIFLSR